MLCHVLYEEDWGKSQPSTSNKVCEVQNVASWIANASDSGLSGADASPGFGNPYMF